MLKYVLILMALVFTTCIAGCGSSTTSGTSVSGITTTPILTTDISGKTLYMKSSTNGFQLNSDLTVTGTRTGTWVLSATGNIVVTDTTGTYTFTCIQKETLYLLVFDTATNEISRLYLDPANAASFDPTKMGGSIQGKDLGLTTPSSINVTTIAGSPSGANTTAISGHVDATGTAASFNRPMDITTDGTNFYVADYSNYVIRKIDASGVVTTLAGSGAQGSADGTGTSASFYNPTGITCDGTNLYVTDSVRQTIRKIVILTKVVTTIAGIDGIAGSVDSTTGTSAGFNAPTGITTDGTNLYVADYGNQTIRKVIISSGAVSTIAGNAGKIGSDNGISISARFYYPSYITTDGSSLYVTDFGNRTIRKIVIATGLVTTLVGSPDAASASVDGTATAASFYHLGGITSDGINLYVSDYSDAVQDDKTHELDINHPWKSFIRKVVIASGTVTTLAGGSVTTLVSHPVDGTGDVARFVTPIGITTDGSGLYLADSTYNNIRLLK